MDNMCYAGLSTQRLDYLKNYELKKKPFYNGHNYTYNDNTLQDILYHCGDSSKNSNVTTNASDEFLGTYRRKGNRYGEGVAGLESEIINDMNMRNRRNKIGINQNSTDIKNILQNSYSDNYLSIGSTINNENENNENENENNNNNNNNNNNINNNNNNNKLNINKNIGSVTSLLSDKGHVMPPKKTLTRHIDDTEIGKYFSTKYAVTDKSTGRTEIMVQRKPGSSNVIVQNFSAFDAYATFRAENKRNSRPDSFVHTKMGIVPIEGAEREERRNKGNAIFTHQHRRDNIAPENYWLCPTVESEQKKHSGNC